MTKQFSPEQAKAIIEKCNNFSKLKQDDRMSKENQDSSIRFERATIRYDILETLATGEHTKTEIEYGGITWRFRLLQLAELEEIELKVKEKANKIGDDMFKLLEWERGVLTLAKALTSCAEANDGILRAEDIKAMNLDFFLGLCKEYALFNTHCNLSLDTLTDAQFHNILELLKKKQIFLTDLDCNQLFRITLYLLEFYLQIEPQTQSEPMLQ